MPSRLVETVRIPLERVGALVGTNGATKKKIERISSTKIEVDSETGEVELSAKPGETMNFYGAVKAVKAIGRGFAPEKALLLLDPEFLLEVIKVSDVVGKSENAMKIKKGRVIGRGGAARELIEDETGCHIAVFGKTISIIGRADEASKAEHAVQLLLHGSKHKKVADFLHRASAEERRFTI